MNKTIEYLDSYDKGWIEAAIDGEGSKGKPRTIDEIGEFETLHILTMQLNGGRFL